MPRSSDATENRRPDTARECPRGTRRRLARDLFLVGLRETLGGCSGDGYRDAAPPLATLLARALAGMPAGAREASPAPGGSHGR